MVFLIANWGLDLIQVLLDVILLDILGSVHKAQERITSNLSTSYAELNQVWHQAFGFQLKKMIFIVWKPENLYLALSIKDLKLQLKSPW